MGFEFLLWTFRAWMQRSPCMCNFMCIKDFVIKIDFHSKICPHFLTTWAWLSCSFHLVKLISKLLFILRHAVALVVVVGSCFDVWGWNKKGGFLEKIQNKKKVDFRENIVFLLSVFSQRWYKPFVDVQWAAAAWRSHKHQLFWGTWVALALNTAAIHGRCLQGSQEPLSLQGNWNFPRGQKQQSPRGEMSPFSFDLFHPVKGKAGA